MKKVAIFDVDGTIFRSSLLVELVETMIEEGIFPKEARAKYARAEKQWLDRAGKSQQSDYEGYIEKVIEAFVDNIKGVSFKDFERIVSIVISRYQNHVYRFTRDLVKGLKKKGYYLLAISQSPKGVLDAFCKNLGFNKVYGRFYELGGDDRFTGRITDEHLISNKANIVKRALQKENLTLKGSVGVGDTEGDISFLELVESPICFNPNSILYRHAKRNGWKVVVERKDVIYELKGSRIR